MNSIQIIISNLDYYLDIYIDNKNNKIKINNIEKDITKEQINDLLRTIRNWENEYTDNKTIDGEKFEIIISSNNEIETIKGNGSYPSNYSYFKEWIRDIYE